MSTVLRLRAHELPEALAGSDAPRAVVDELLWQEVAGSCPTLSPRHLGGWRLQAGVEYTLLYSDHSHCGLMLLTPALRAIRGAALTAVVARTFIASGVVTVSVLGSGLAARMQITALATHVPGISHVAVHGPGRVPAAVAEQLALAGIGLTVATSATDAVFGANLVILAGQRSRAGWPLADGAVVVNATGQAAPEGMSARADQVFVDDRRLHDDQRAADLGQVLAGTHPGRTAPDEVLLVDLLGMDAGGVWLAHQLYQAATRHGLGVQDGIDGYQGGMWP
jgi:ornithine cyclodeaminase/alanine dehydrogenase-like protein (mu-crystallin family)